MKKLILSLVLFFIVTSGLGTTQMGEAAGRAPSKDRVYTQKEIQLKYDM